MADVGKMGIQPRLALSCLKIFVLLECKIENTVDFSKVAQNSTVMVMGTIV